jgi:hypothetical protein
MITKAETSRVVVQVYCHANSGKTVGSRWGSVTFDSAGYGKLSLEKEDLKLLDQLGWMLPEDKAAAFGKSAEPEPTPEPAPKPLLAREPDPEELLPKKKIRKKTARKRKKSEE